MGTAGGTHGRSRVHRVSDGALELCSTTVSSHLTVISSLVNMVVQSKLQMSLTDTSVRVKSRSANMCAVMDGKAGLRHSSSVAWDVILDQLCRKISRPLSEVIFCNLSIVVSEQCFCGLMLYD